MERKLRVDPVGAAIQWGMVVGAVGLVIWVGTCAYEASQASQQNGPTQEKADNARKAAVAPQPAVEPKLEGNPAVKSVVEDTKRKYDFVLPCGDKELEIVPHTASEYPEGAVGVTMLLKGTGCESAWIKFPAGFRPFQVFVENGQRVKVFWYERFSQRYEWYEMSNPSFPFQGADDKVANKVRFVNPWSDARVAVLFYEH